MTVITVCLPEEVKTCLEERSTWNGGGEEGGGGWWW